MKPHKKPMDKEAARQLRTELYEAIGRGELNLQDAVKRMRKISRLTQAEFAAHRGVSVKVIKEIERGAGNPTVASLNRIGGFFGLEVAFVRSDRLQRAAASVAAPPQAIQDVLKEMEKNLSDIQKALSESM